MSEGLIKKIIDSYKQEISDKEIIIPEKEEENLQILERILQAFNLTEKPKKKIKKYGKLTEEEIYLKLHESIDFSFLEKLVQKGEIQQNYATRMKNAFSNFKTYGDFFLSGFFRYGESWLFNGMLEKGQKIMVEHFKKIKLYSLAKNKDNLKEIYESKEYEN